MEFRDEWDQLIRAARSRPDAEAQSSGQDARMTLASAQAKGGGGSSGSLDLKVSQEPWTSASGVANALQASTSVAATRLSAAHEGVTWGLEGFMTPAVLNEVRTSWIDRLGDVKAECHRLEGKLKAAAKEFGEVEARVAHSFPQQQSRGDSQAGR
ncbi:hypothetical protein [Streptomyces sp. MST-110588]|uniref:hypothetical protein n=1 Tax=Streptomyces sp. MST-110588 TaxID=2833628 RepID=UPI001F5C6E62|nr:hypothetical protein [Streptomyces sp. MST-110588]UNO41062.1 hypothetical protein KGS77_17555 [Streptomyces sp. MST-110588]